MGHAVNINKIKKTVQGNNVHLVYEYETHNYTVWVLLQWVVILLPLGFKWFIIHNVQFVIEVCMHFFFLLL